MTKVDILNERKIPTIKNLDLRGTGTNKGNPISKVNQISNKKTILRIPILHFCLISDHSPIRQAVEDNKYASSGEDSVVIMDDLPPPVTIPSTPDGSPYNTRRYEADRPRRLEDSSSDGSSSSSSSSDSDSDYSKSSVGSRLTDKSDRSIERVPTPTLNNGYDHRKYVLSHVLIM